MVAGDPAGRTDQDVYGPPYFQESEINLAMALMLRDELESRGIAVVMTRETGTASNVYGEDVNGDGRTILDGQQHGDRDECRSGSTSATMRRQTS